MDEQRFEALEQRIALLESVLKEKEALALKEKEALEKRIAFLESAHMERESAGDPDIVLLKIGSSFIQTSRQKIVGGTRYGSKLNSAFNGRNKNPFNELSVFHIPMYDDKHFEDMFQYIIVPHLNGDTALVWQRVCEFGGDVLAHHRMRKVAEFFEVDAVLDVIDNHDKINCIKLISDLIKYSPRICARNKIIEEFSANNKLLFSLEDVENSIIKLSLNSHRSDYQQRIQPYEYRLRTDCQLVLEMNKYLADGDKDGCDDKGFIDIHAFAIYIHAKLTKHCK